MQGKGGSDVKEACPKAVELDLSRNLFEEWREVASVCEQLERLRNLRVEYVLLRGREVMGRVLTCWAVGIGFETRR